MNILKADDNDNDNVEATHSLYIHLYVKQLRDGLLHLMCELIINKSTK